MSVGQRVKHLRQRLDLTQKQFAAKIPTRGEGTYDWTYIGKIERDDQYPSLKYLEKIADTFSVPLSYFFQDGRPTSSQKQEFMAKKVKSLACFLSHYRWDLAHFAVCQGCNFKPLCTDVKWMIENLK